jgi:hypothetical protein
LGRLIPCGTITQLIGIAHYQAHVDISLMLNLLRLLIKCKER